MLGHYVLEKKEWRTKESGGTWVEVPWWKAYTGTGLALVSIMVSFLSINTALLLWLLLPLRDLILLYRPRARPTHGEL